MIELNREQIIKALECCGKGNCDPCPNDDRKSCIGKTVADALSLIEQLIEENERLSAELAERPPKLIITKLLKGKRKESGT